MGPSPVFSCELPLLEWSYLGDAGVRHLGPTAEAFHAAFLSYDFTKPPT